MTKLRHLIAEVDAALDIYLAGRTGQQFHKVAFILADDCCELASKLFLTTANAAWSDANASGRFKAFNTVTGEVRAARPATGAILTRIEGRRVRRNGFFHSAHLLDLTLQTIDVTEALRDLLDYGALLFGGQWDVEVRATRNLETAQLLLRLDCAAYADPRITRRVVDIFATQPGGGNAAARAKGCELAHHPDDHHLRLAVRNGGPELRDRLAALLAQIRR